MERRGRQSIFDGGEPKVTSSPQSLSDISRAQSVHLLRSIKSKKRLMRKAAHLFNKKSSKGIKFLVDSGVIADPVTPRSVASFLRNGIMVGLDKKAVGAYLGEIGKAPVAGKSPPNWERDWFHKEALETYCSLFRFEGQSLLDGLRMFLACFRLPGEAQQIDRILQAFSDSCSRLCEEGSQAFFSEDPKRASDAAYLLSFSIIMLNTDQHNDNIREDRKMIKNDFIRYNSDYGQDITDPGKELSKEYLSSIYDSIRLEEIRTEGEGADGSMTVERWKDVLRGSVDDDSDADKLPTIHDAEDLTELVLEHVWMPIMSAISALWGIKQTDPSVSTMENGPSGMLATQGARLGMDMAYDMMVGVRNLGRTDVFLKIFNCVCMYTGLLRYDSNAADRVWTFANSIESQGAFILSLRIARETNEDIGVEGFKKIWSMIFELRDLKMLGGGVSNKSTSIAMESDPDLLKEYARKDWNTKLMNKGPTKEPQETQSGGLWTALFGATEESVEDVNSDAGQLSDKNKTIHGKESHIRWDEVAFDDGDDGEGSQDATLDASSSAGESSIGAEFEQHLIKEGTLLSRQRESMITGLERVEDAQALGISPRGRVRNRLEKCCDYVGLVSDSRFMDDEGLCTLLQALIALLPDSTSICKSGDDGERSPDETPVSPASAAFAEVLICEIALRNRDRLTMLWRNILQAHYSARLEAIAHCYTDNEEAQWQILSGSIEKAITGLLRISCCAVQKGQVPNEVLSTWSILESIEQGEKKMSLMNWFDLHLGEGLWRITRCVDGATKLQESGWKGLFSLSYWCADRGCKLAPIRSSEIGQPVGLAEDDPSLQAYRSLHFLLNASEVKDHVPANGISTTRCLMAAGNNRNCPKLSIAGLDLLYMFTSQGEDESEKSIDFWYTVWKPVVEGMTEAIGLSAYTSVRQHALSMLTDSFLDKQAGFIPISHLCDSLGKLCIPLAGRGIVELREGRIKIESIDELMIELELCIGLIFKPLRHHLKYVEGQGEEALLSIWKPILDVLKDVLSDPSSNGSKEALLPAEVLRSTNELTVEHLRNVITVLTDLSILQAESESPNDITQLTWDAIEGLAPCKEFVKEWKEGVHEA